LVDEDYGIIHFVRPVGCYRIVVSFMGLAHFLIKLYGVMVENTNSTILEVQGSFGLTYMVGIIPLNLRSQEMDKGVPHARAAATAGQAGLGPGVAWHNR
jgi:hypothetical protein